MSSGPCYARLLAAALALSCLLASACSSVRIPLSELPAAPIAMTYWTPDEARKINDKLAGVPLPRLGIADLNRLGRTQETALDVLEREPGRLVLFDPRTRTITRVEAAPPGAQALAFSPDRTKLLFTASKISGRSQIYEVDLVSGDLHPLTHGEAHTRADYLPEGLVWNEIDTGEQGGGQILRGNRSGGRAQPLYQGFLGEDLRASPSGALLAWAGLRAPPAGRSGREPQWFLYLADVGPGGVAASDAVAASEPRPVAPGRGPAFHPDGEWIAYSAPSASVWQLRRIRTDGTGRALLGPAAIDSHSPAFSPDGRYVAYVARDSLGMRLFVRRFDGSGDRVLLEHGMALSPVW